MDIRFQGVLRDPLDNPMPNHEIRITALHTDETIKGSTVVFYTDASGAYDFYLLKGFYSLEVLNTAGDEYLLTGNLCLNQSTPQNITLEDALKYSEDIEPEDTVVLDAMWSTWWNSLVNASLTSSREHRDQINHAEAHSVDLQETWASEDDIEHGAQRTLEVKAGDARIQEQHRVFDDEFAATGSKVETSQASVHETANVGTEIDRKKTQTSVTSTNVENEHVGLEIRKDETSTTTSGSWNKLKELAANIREVVSFAFGSNRLNKRSSVSTSAEEAYDTLVGSKASSVTHSNNGTTTRHEIIVDEHFIGKTPLSPTMFVDTATGKVTVYGQLQISELLDENGNPIDLDPEDGDTIFQVYQYSDSSNGPWEDTVQPYHYWRRENWSINGVVDPGTWSQPYQFRGFDGEPGDPGDTIYVEYQYSPDALVWHDPPLTSGDKWRRERIVTNGVAGPWSDAGQIVGDAGSTVEVRSEYSIDGIYNWHSILDPADKFERRATFENGVQVTPWTDPFPIGQGPEGVPGRNGSGWYTLVNATGAWPGDATATAEFTAAFGRTPVLDDHLTYTNNSNPDLVTASEVKRCNSDFGQPVTWSTPAMIIQGDLIARGTISGDRLVANTITGNEISSATTIIAGAGSWTAGMNGDDSAGAGIYQNWRFWAGAADPSLAPFRVNRDGSLWASNANINGHVTATSGSFTGDIFAETLTLSGIDVQIKSSNYVAGVSGWALFNDGDAEFNNGTFRGTLYAEDVVGDFYKVSTHVTPTSLNYTTGPQTLHSFTLPAAGFDRIVYIDEMEYGTGTSAPWLNGTYIRVMKNGAEVYNTASADENYNGFLYSGYRTRKKTFVVDGQETEIQIQLVVRENYGAYYGQTVVHTYSKN